MLNHCFYKENNIFNLYRTSNQALIYYQNQRYKNLNLVFGKENQTRDILNVLMNLKVPLAPKDAHNWEFVILELLSNSIRASQEKNSNEPIQLEISLNQNSFKSVISDGAGGFDTQNLPYPLHGAMEKIHALDESFHSYSMDNDFLRFGIGLYSAKKFSDKFDIHFLNLEKKKIHHYKKNQTYGTVISITKTL